MRKSLIAICLVLTIMVSLFPTYAGATSTLKVSAAQYEAFRKQMREKMNSQFTIDGVTYKEDTFKPLKEGARGNLVKAAQERLIEYNCLLDKADGVFGSKTANAVYLFQSANEMERTGTLNFDTMKLLMSDSARAYEEENFCVYLDNNATWQMNGSDKMVFKAKVRNFSMQHTVELVHFNIKALDSNGNPLDNKGNVVTGARLEVSQDVTIRPGKTSTLPGFTLSGRKKIREVHCAIAWIMLSDGRFMYPDDDEAYIVWEIGW